MPNAKEQAKAMKSNALKKSNKNLEKEFSEDDRTVVYKDVLPGVDIAYTVKTNVLKEDIILNDPSATNVFEMDILAKGVSMVERDGGVFFIDSEGNKVFRLTPLFMIDANGKYSEDVTYTIEPSKKGGKITITADRDFLDAADTQYPVIIDPSIMVAGTSDTFDTCVDEQYPNSNYYLSENLWTGGKTGTNTMRTYIRFDLPANIRGANVTSAYLRIKKRDYATPTIKAYRVTGSWVSNAVKWSSKPGYTTTNGTGTIALDTGSWYKLNVTTLVKNWMSGTYVNHGFLLKEPSETSTTQKTRFYSSDAPSPNKPELVINYSALRPTKTFDVILYKNSNMSTSLTT